MNNLFGLSGGVQTEPQETPKNKSTFVETIVDVNRMETEISTTSAGAIQGSNVIEIGQSSKRRSNGKFSINFAFSINNYNMNSKN